MKIKFDIDCTPQEARSFFGLPDVTVMQEALLQDLQNRVAETLATADPETLMKTWMPAGVQGLEALQKMFWSSIGTPPETKD